MCVDACIRVLQGLKKTTQASISDRQGKEDTVEKNRVSVCACAEIRRSLLCSVLWTALKISILSWHLLVLLLAQSALLCYQQSLNGATTVKFLVL